PKPPVCTCAAGFTVVGMTFVGCANVSVATTFARGALGSFGKFGALDATLISGALTSGSGSGSLILCTCGGTISLATAGASTGRAGAGLIFTCRRGFTG